MGASFAEVDLVKTSARSIVYRKSTRIQGSFEIGRKNRDNNSVYFDYFEGTANSGLIFEPTTEFPTFATNV